MILLSLSSTVAAVPETPKPEAPAGKKLRFIQITTPPKKKITPETTFYYFYLPAHMETCNFENVIVLELSR